MLQPENITKKYDFLFADIDSGKIKIPKFQRDFVWSKEQSAKLIDSLIKGFPIGTFIFWKTTEELKHIKNIGNINLPEAPAGEPVMYVLDGQQRITSLYAVRKGAIIDSEGQRVNYGDIYINLNLEPDGDDQVVSVEPPEKNAYITVHDLLTLDLTGLFENYKDHIKTIDIYKRRLTTYDFSTIVITNYPLDIACEVFTRINTGGTELTLFEIMVAKTYDSEKNFDLAERFNLLIDNKGKAKDLEDANYETISPSTILQCLSAHLTKLIQRKDILKISKEAFIDSWPDMVDGLFTAVDFLRTTIRVPVSQLLPYNVLLVPLTYFFVKNYCRKPNPTQEKYLCQYFWWASLSSRYSSGMEGKVAQDLERMDAIIQNKQPDYRGSELNLSFDDLHWRWFSTGDAFCKAILCLLAYQGPKSFNNDALVTLDNSWLRTTSSKNYHHFFPRAYLTKKRGYEDWQANTILNITIVDDHLNKQKIGARSPGDYMLGFLDENPKLQTTMQSHLIDDLDVFGVWDDDYDKFIQKRGERIIEEIKKRLNP